MVEIDKEQSRGDAAGYVAGKQGDEKPDKTASICGNTVYRGGQIVGEIREGGAVFTVRREETQQERIGTVRMGQYYPLPQEQ